MVIGRWRTVASGIDDHVRECHCRHLRAAGVGRADPSWPFADRPNGRWRRPCCSPAGGRDTVSSRGAGFHRGPGRPVVVPRHRQSPQRSTARHVGRHPGGRRIGQFPSGGVERRGHAGPSRTCRRGGRRWSGPVVRGSQQMAARRTTVTAPEESARIALAGRGGHWVKPDLASDARAGRQCRRPGRFRRARGAQRPSLSAIPGSDQSVACDVGSRSEPPVGRRRTGTVRGVVDGCRRRDHDHRVHPQRVPTVGRATGRIGGNRLLLGLGGTVWVAWRRRPKGGAQASGRPVGPLGRRGSSLVGCHSQPVGIQSQPVGNQCRSRLGASPNRSADTKASRPPASRATLAEVICGVAGAG